MKKFIVFLFALISINVLSAQTSFLRASSILIGYKSQYSQDFTWDASPTSVDILIRADESKVTIFSKTTQVYRKISVESKTSKSATYFCNDSEGRTCNLIIFTSDNSPGTIFVCIEYSDMAWIYTTKKD